MTHIEEEYTKPEIYVIILKSVSPFLEESNIEQPDIDDEWDW